MQLAKSLLCYTDWVECLDYLISVTFSCLHSLASSTLIEEMLQYQYLSLYKCIAKKELSIVLCGYAII